MIFLFLYDWNSHQSALAVSFCHHKIVTNINMKNGRVDMMGICLDQRLKSEDRPENGIGFEPDQTRKIFDRPLRVLFCQSAGRSP